MGRILQEVSCVILVASLSLHAATGSATECDGADHCSAVESMEEQQPWKGVQLLQQDSKRSRLEIGTDATSTSNVSEIPSIDMEVPVLASDLALSQGDPEELSEEMQEVLDRHNLYRCMHGVPALEWDHAIAANAQAYADRGVYKHSKNSQRVVNGVPLGENLAWGYPERSGLDSTVAWYSEIKFTRGGLCRSFSDSTVPGEAIGHYTQVVWKSTTRLGCGRGRARVGDLMGDFWVCQYGRAGNYYGQFTSQVVAPVKKASQCGEGRGHSSGGGKGKGHSSGGGAGHVDFEGCVPAGSRQTCQTCTHNVQCAGQGSFCCPYLKKCVPNSRHPCRYPIAQCQPVCGEWNKDYKKDMRLCKKNCENADFPENWLGKTCPGLPPTTTPPPGAPDPNCKDGDKNAGPRILMNGRPTECSRLKIFCNYGFVKRKCKATCNTC